MVKPGLVIIFMAAPIPEEIGEGGSIIGSRIGARN